MIQSHVAMRRIRWICYALSFAAWLYLGFCFATHTRGPSAWIAWVVTFVCGMTNLMFMEVERRRVKKTEVDL